MRCAAWEHFSTDAVRRPQRVHRWNDYGSETLCDMVVDPADRDAFDAHLARIEFGPLGLVTMRSTGARADSGSRGASRWASRQSDALSMTLVGGGTCTSIQDRTTLDVRPGGLFFLDLTRAWSFACEGDMAMRMVKIPFSALAARIDDPTRLLCRSFAADLPAVSVITPLVASIDAMLRDDPARGADPALVELILNAVTLLYRSEADDGRSDERRSQTALRRAATGYIARHLADPELSVAHLCAALSVSPRQLQRAFIADGTTPVQVILAQRLDSAAARLADPDHGSILDLALSVGFNDASHFSRSFARRFGIAPRRYRGTPPI